MSTVYDLADLLALDAERFTERLGSIEIEDRDTGIVFGCRVLSTGEKTHLVGYATGDENRINLPLLYRLFAQCSLEWMQPKGQARKPLAREDARLNGRVNQRVPDAFLDALGSGLCIEIGQRVDRACRLTDEERARLRFIGGSEGSPEPAEETSLDDAPSAESAP